MMYFLTGSFLNVFSQGNNWKLDGNNNSTNTSFLGTTNNFPLQFKTNNQTRFTIGSNGNYTFHSLSGNSNALMLLNNNGEAYRLNFSQNSNDVLTGNGSWQSINTLVPQYWQLTNAGLYTTQPVVVNNTITATGIQILHKIEADTIKGLKKVDINGNITLGEDGAYKGIAAKIEDLNINSKPGFDFNTILNANTNGNVGIGTSNPSKKLDVNGDARVSGTIAANAIETEIFRTDTIKVNRILPLPGDTLIYFGDSTIVFHTASNRISWTQNCTNNNNINLFCRGFSIGNGSTNAVGLNSIAIGNNVGVSSFFGAVQAMVIGNGVSETQRLINNTSNSLAIGFNSTIPTLFVSSASGANTTGNVGIGTTAPQAKLHIFHNETGLASIRFERAGYTTYDIKQSSGNGLSFVKSATGQIAIYLADTGNVGIGGTTSPLAKLEVKGEVRFTHFNNSQNYIRLGHDGASAIIDNFGVGDLLINYYNGRNVIIGNSLNGDSDLRVCGIVKAKKVRVESNWCDFVFDESFVRMSVLEKEEFYLKYKHLPNIASEEDIIKDGLDIGNVLKGMMQNIEEDRLDITELYKKLIKLEQENIELRHKIIELRNEMK